MKYTLLVILIFHSALRIEAQTGFEKNFDERVISFFEKFHPESIMIHSNAKVYFAGEMIWYNMYLYNTPYSLNHLSSIAYLELCRNQEVLCRQKLKLTDGVAAGDILLPKDLSTGYYQIRAYSTWMKNLTDSAGFKQNILIINPENPSYGNAKAPGNSKKEKEPRMFELIDENNEVSISVGPVQEGFVAILNNGRVMLLREVKQGVTQEFRIPKGQLMNNSLIVGMFDETGILLFEKKMTVNLNTLSIITNKKNYSPRDRIDITINNQGLEKIQGYCSITVRHKSEIAEQDSSDQERTSDWTEVLRPRVQTLRWPKEKIIYPKSLNSLEPISFTTRADTASKGKNSMGVVHRDVLKSLTRDKLLRRISESYSISSPHVKDSSHQLPYDISYSPKDFVNFATLDDFLVEIIPQLKVRKIKGVRSIRIRNNENSNKVYFYSGEPMLVIDGVVINDAKELLMLDPTEVMNINVAYKLHTINSSGIAGLADNGILSITKKKKTDSYLEESLIYRGFHIASISKTPSYHRNNSNLDVIPDLRNHVYWNPKVEINSKAISFYLSDELGEFVIEVKGVKSDGSLFTLEETFEVIPRKRY